MSEDTTPVEAKAIHLLFLSTLWGMQLWVTFISGPVLGSNLTRHMYGCVQSQLLPYYLHLGSAFSFFNLIIFALYHPLETLGEEETMQIIIYFIGVTLAALNAQLFGKRTSEIMSDMHLLEQSRGLGQEIGFCSNRSYSSLHLSDPKYKALASQLTFYHNMSSICNLCCIICTGLNLYYLAAHLSTL